MAAGRCGRRDFVVGALSLAGCGSLTKCGRDEGPRVASDTAPLPALLDELLAAARAAGFAVDDLQPGLKRAEIEQKTRGLPFALPEELYTLYQWRNGSKPERRLFLFRDQVFSPLEVAVRDLSGLSLHGVTGALPFAAFEGSFYALHAEPYALDPRYERPVVCAFEGADVYFHSLAKLLETQIAWIEQGIHRADGRGVDGQKERAVWLSVNPGLFQD